MFAWKLLSETSDMSIGDFESKRGQIKVKRIDYCLRIGIKSQ